MGLIHVLDTEVSNKIAAGEVVEKPLSIVKELVENSIDAGASMITIEIRGGGIKYIRVSDNGSGMSGEDAKICFLRHATSKISSGDDLDAIYTLGFRGEALSSIGAVSRVKLYTKRIQDSMGVCVTCEGGEILSSADAGAPDGTVIEVCDLFYNTPARLKFLKKPATEGGYISDLIARYIFAHPEISFKLVRDGKEILFSAGDNRLTNAVYSVYGKDFAKNMLEVDYEFNGIRVSGMIGKGTLSRPNRNNETFFVNKRYIKSAIMIRALEEAYKNQIMISKFPTAILNIELDARDVDINVHPTKLECKFSNESDIYQAVYHAAKSALYAMPNVPQIERAEKPKSEPEPKESPFKPEGGEQQSVEEIYSRMVRESSRPSNEFKFKAQHREAPVKIQSEPKPEAEPVTPAISRASAVPAMPMAEKNPDIEAVTEVKAIPAVEEIPDIEKIPVTESIPNTVPEPICEPEPEQKSRRNTFAMIDYARELGRERAKRKTRVMDSAEAPEEPMEQESKLPSWREYAAALNAADNAEQQIETEVGLRVIGQLFETYILVEKDDKLLMIDQHAAHERLNFEALKKELAEHGVSSQFILEPVEIKLSGEEFAVYSEHKSDINKLGFDCTDNGTDIVSLTSIPQNVGWSGAEPLFLELLTQIAEMNNDLIAHDYERLLYTISCKAAIKANMAVSMPEMRALVKKVMNLNSEDKINTCPHGRPIVISMSKKEIEKDFKRIV